MVEVVSSLERDGRPVFRDLRWGVYVVLKAPNSYAAACFTQYGLPTDSTGRYAAIYKPFHLIGLELSISVLNAALRGESTGTAREWRGDVVAVAKRALKSGETLDGEGGYTVYGKLVPVVRSLTECALPMAFRTGPSQQSVQLKPAPGMRWPSPGLHPSFARLVTSLLAPL
jgi:predicted homoserine dehydrogenase-like protein